MVVYTEKTPARTALQIGLQRKNDLGVDPCKFGGIGSTGSHFGLAIHSAVLGAGAADNREPPHPHRYLPEPRKRWFILHIPFFSSSPLRGQDCMKDALFPAGHFYSPIVDTADVAQRREAIWPENPSIPWIDFNDAHHRKVLGAWLPEMLPEFTYPREGPEDDELEGFYIDNSQFSHLDCRILFTLLRSWKPRHMIEVGGGYSTLLTANVNERFFGSKMHFTCIEPYPRSFIETQAGGLTELLKERVENVPLARFEALEAGDVLFIDSSHVCKTGSDVNYLYFEVIPRLPPGVRVHVHDVFLPAEYPQEWVIEHNRSWNEQYLVRAMLSHSARYRVLFGSMYAALNFGPLIQQALALPEGTTMGGGSFWFEVIQARGQVASGSGS